MFWRFGGYANISTIDTLLDKPEVTLEELLDESDLIQELKAHNTKLIEYLREENTLKKLLDYVVAPGPPINEDDDTRDDDDEEEATSDKRGKEKSRGLFVKTKDEEKDEDAADEAEKKRLKYSYVACEVLSSETWSILEAMISNVPHLTEFWEFLRRPPPLDPLQAGYFTKVNETLLEKKTEDMLEFFRSLPDIIPSILQHVDCPMVMDLLLKIISLEKQEGGQGIVDWLQAQRLIPTLLSYLSADCNSSTQTSAGDFLKAIITISANAAQNEQSCIGPNSLTRQLVSEPCMQSLITSMLQGGNPLTVGVGIVIEVIRKNNSDYDPENGHNPDAPPTSHDPIYLGTLLRMFAKHVPDFMALILNSKHTVTEGDRTIYKERAQLDSAWGTKIEPLGFDRFKTCELMAELLHCSNMGLLNEKGSEEFIVQRDAERERLKAQGFLADQKQEEETADMTEDSVQFNPSLGSSLNASSVETRAVQPNDEDGFEKVSVPVDATDPPGEPKSTTARLPSASQDRLRIEIGDDLVDEPLSSPKSGSQAGVAKSNDMPSTLKTRAPSSILSPTTDITERVRKVSLEDETMTSPPNEEESITDKTVSNLAPAETSLSPTSPHPEDKPAPLFSKKSDPKKTPTSASPTQPASPRQAGQEDSAISIDQQVQDIVTMDDSVQGASEMTDIEDDKPVVGDYLKIMFVENKVVPTILSFFFRFPWNNFLHNVVYDVVQQVFNGLMDRGYNRQLAIDLFENGGITDQIVEGQQRSDEAQRKKNMRLGYMGHLTLVAEEVVKFSERHPAELLSQTVMERVLDRQWIDYVEQTLSETRERDNAILGGVRPDVGMGPRQAVLNAVNASQGFGNSSALANAGLNGGLVGQQGLDSIDLSNNGSATGGSNGSGSLLSSGFGSSSDDDDEDMDDPDDEEQKATPGSATETENSNQPIPLLPPPPAPLNIPPSRARRQLARQLALHKQEAEQSAVAEQTKGEPASEDPFASLGDKEADTRNRNDPFALEEEEEDITTSGNRNNGNNQSGFSVSRGISSLFSSGSMSRRKSREAGFDEDDHRPDLDDDSTSEETVSDDDQELGTERHPLETRASQERQPLEVDDDDEEMGEMVAPEEESGPNSSDEEAEVLSPMEKEKLRAGSFGMTTTKSPDVMAASPAEGVTSDEDEDGDGMIEIHMPSARKMT